MRRDVVPWLKVAVCGVVLCGYLALLSTLMFPMVILVPIVGAMAFMPIGERLHRDYSWYSQVTTGLSMLALLAIVISGADLGALNMVVGLMMLVQVHALVHIKRQRHYSYLMLMSFSEVMAASMMSPSPEIGLVYVILVVFTIWTLVLLDIFRGTEEQGEVYVHGTLDYEARNGALRESGGRAFRRNMVGWISGMAVASIALSATLFLVIPRTEAGAFGGQDVFQVQEETTTGLSAEINLRAGGRISEDLTAVMEVNFPELPEGLFRGPLYWRVTTFDKYSDGGWTRQGLESRSLVLFRRSARFAAHPEGTRGSEEGVYRADYSAKNTVEFEVFLAELPQEGVPVLSLPLMVQPQNTDPGLWGWDTAGDFTVHHRSRGETGISYRGVSVIGERLPDRLRTSREDFHELMSRTDYALLTEHDLLPETVALVEQITAGQDNIYDKLAAIERFLSSDDFTYTLDVPELPDDHPMDAFIHHVQTGHCQFFASAMALMARSQSVPTRLVSGYRGGNYDPDTQSYTVTANMAHIWVEVFLPDFGWTIFDPSPAADAPATFSLGNFQAQYSTFVLRLKLLWLRQVVGYNAREGGRVLGSASDDDERPEARVVAARGESDANEAVSENLPRTIFALLLLTGLVCAGLVLRSVLRSRRALAGLDEGQMRAVSLYALLRKRLTRLGVSCEGKTAEEVAAAAASRHDSLSATVGKVVSHYNAARFGTRPFPPEEFAALKQEVSSLRLAPDQR